MRLTLGLVGAGVVAVAALYYLWDVLRGNTRPHTGSWLVWAVIGLLGFGASTEAGAGPGGYAAAIYAVACAVTFLVSLHPKYGKRASEWYDWPLCGVAVLGIMLWHFGQLRSGAAATLAVVCDGIGLWPTLREAWRRPGTESRPAWAADAIGAFLCLIAVSTYSYAAMVYPAYLFLANGSVASTLALRRKNRYRW